MHMLLMAFQVLKFTHATIHVKMRQLTSMPTLVFLHNPVVDDM